MSYSFFTLTDKKKAFELLESALGIAATAAFAYAYDKGYMDKFGKTAQMQAEDAVTSTLNTGFSQAAMDDYLKEATTTMAQLREQLEKKA